MNDNKNAKPGSRNQARLDEAERSLESLQARLDSLEENNREIAVSLSRIMNAVEAASKAPTPPPVPPVPTSGSDPNLASLLATMTQSMTSSLDSLRRDLQAANARHAASAYLEFAREFQEAVAKQNETAAAASKPTTLADEVSALLANPNLLQNLGTLRNMMQTKE